MSWGGEYSQLLAAESQLSFIGPLALVLIFMILFALYGNFKFPMTIAIGRGHDRAGGRAGGAQAHAHAIQRFLRAGTAGAAGRLGGDGA